MRKFKLLALAFVIGTASLFAVNIDEPENPSKEIRNEIVKLLQSPEFTVENDMTVVIKFTFNSEGEIVVLSVDTDYLKVEKFIKSRLNYEKVTSSLVKGKEYTVPIRIVVKA